MKRAICLAAVVLAALLGGGMFEASDLAGLEPVQVVRIRTEEDDYLVETDTGARGRGATPAEAFDELKHHASGEIFLDTVAYVLVPREDPQLLRELMICLRPACRVCLETDTVPLADVAGYLHIHGPRVTLMACQGESVRLPRLTMQEGEMELVP